MSEPISCVPRGIEEDPQRVTRSMEALREAQADCALVLETLIERLRMEEDGQGYVCISDSRGHRVRLSPYQGQVVEQGREALRALADRREALVLALLSLPEEGGR